MTQHPKAVLPLRPGLRAALSVLTLPLILVLMGACSSSNSDEIKARLVTPISYAATGPGAAPTGLATPFAKPEVILSTNTASQAGAILVSVTGPVTSGSVAFLSRNYALTKGTQSMYAYVAIDADDLPGIFPVSVSYALPNGSRGTLPDEAVTVLRKNWSVDDITIGPELEPLLNGAVASAEQNQLRSIYQQYSPLKMWSAGWIQPIEAPLTTNFGEIRSYNGSAPTGHHGGADFGAPAGEPVAATNGGRVVLARQLQIRGNMVIIDHGGGVFSGYAHLSSFAVAEGQFVSQADIIGYVGSTGLSTGAHLHWEMAVGGVNVDGIRFTNGTDGFRGGR